MAEQVAQFRIVDSDTGRRQLDYATRPYADAWLRAHPEYRVYSQHTDSPALELHAIYVERAAAHSTSVEG